MYAKIFASTFDGTLRGRRDALLVMVFLCANCDRDSVVDISPRAISDATGLSLDETLAALAELEAPDPESRSPAEDGRRIIRIDDRRSWGWRIVNHLHYRELRNPEDRRIQNRDAQARARRKKTPGGVSDGQHASANVSTRHHGSAASAHADADADADADAATERDLSTRKDGGSPPSPAAPGDRKRNGKSQQKPQPVTQTDLAMFYYNKILGKTKDRPDGLPKATRINMPAKCGWVRRCADVAREVCQELYGSPQVTPTFWEQYFTSVAADPFKSGKQKPGPGHEGWVPDFEYLLKRKTMMEVFERSGAADDDGHDDADCGAPDRPISAAAAPGRAPALLALPVEEIL